MEAEELFREYERHAAGVEADVMNYEPQREKGEKAEKCGEKKGEAKPSCEGCPAAKTAAA